MKLKAKVAGNCVEPSKVYRSLRQRDTLTHALVGQEAIRQEQHCLVWYSRRREVYVLCGSGGVV